MTQKYHRYTKEIPKESNRNPILAPQKCHRNPREISWNSSRNPKEFLQKCQRNPQRVAKTQIELSRINKNGIRTKKELQKNAMKIKKGKLKKKVKAKRTYCFYLRKGLDTIEDPQNNHTIEDQAGSWTTPLKNCLGAMV